MLVQKNTEKSLYHDLVLFIVCIGGDLVLMERVHRYNARLTVKANSLIEEIFIE